MKRKLAVVHWMPVELYPPATNLVREFASQGWDVTVHTTHNRHNLTEFAESGVSVVRSASATHGNPVQRAAAYASFHLRTARSLLGSAPDAILYFEPQSSFPVFLSGIVRPGVPVFIHHHEYHAPAEFRAPGMRLARLFHDIEQKTLFPRARWISHTNNARLELFLADNGETLRDKAKVLANLPPASWGNEPNRAWSETLARPLRMVYVGSLSREDTYIENCLEWIVRQPAGTVTLDIFAYNVDDETRAFLTAATNPAIRFHPEGARYDDLPEILRDFHTGLILYRAKTANYRHNASNKLFEYLACGLDVVFPAAMLGVKQYERLDSVPRIIEMDFDSDDVNVNTLAHRGGLPQASPPESAGAALRELSEAIASAVDENT